MAAKVAGTAFLAVLVPIYLHILWLGVLWLALWNSWHRYTAGGWPYYSTGRVAFLPTHLALRKIFAAPPPAAGLKLPIRFL